MKNYLLHFRMFFFNTRKKTSLPGKKSLFLFKSTGPQSGHPLPVNGKHLSTEPSRSSSIKKEFK
ncbi:hypothetical protein [Pinibacter aurantiacus]|uniref:hypothetical protein n=1 Tax=Pinibacter aurantiacus TaxID=2851599 RepID=UPI001C3949CA|nr:hypothetical protein [Pinibacter aurantiacus]